MKLPQALWMLFGSIVIALACASSVAQQPLITSFHHNGEVTWTNVPGTNGFTVQWAPAVTGPWSSNWHGLDSILTTSPENTVLVPMFYRVVQGFSLATMRGLWIGAAPSMGNIYFRLEDSGLVSELGAFNIRTPNGYFTVTPAGAVTVTFLFKDGPFSFGGQVGQPTNSLGTLYRVDHAGLCAGRWTGSLSQTTGPGSPANYPLSLEVDSSGWVHNLVGFLPFASGRLFAVTNGVAAGFITTGEDGPYSQIQISGTLAGNTFSGFYEVDDGLFPGSMGGTVLLNRP